jgi:GGDEF domain-containing protein
MGRPDLLPAGSADSTQLLRPALTLLIRNLGVDRAQLTRLTEEGLDVLCWASAPRARLGGAGAFPEKGFCPYLLAHPERPLIIRDAAANFRWRNSPGHLELGIGAYAGVTLWSGTRAVGTLCVQHHAARDFPPAGLALLKTLAPLMTCALESEQLRLDLQEALRTLEQSSAILEGGLTMSPRSGLPNRHFLDIWLRPALATAQRRKEAMVLALWSQPLVPGARGRLTATARSLRGGDLLMELSKDQYLLLMPHTDPAKADAPLSRLRQALGGHPTGATAWRPNDQDMTLESALRRVGKAFTDANRDGTGLVWNQE